MHKEVVHEKPNLISTDSYIGFVLSVWLTAVLGLALQIWLFGPMAAPDKNVF